MNVNDLEAIRLHEKGWFFNHVVTGVDNQVGVFNRHKRGRFDLKQLTGVGDDILRRRRHVVCDVEDAAERTFGEEFGRTGDIADTLGEKITTLGPVRANLIKKGMVFSPSHGEMAFTVPLFDEFMRRAMPDFQT